MPTYQYRCETCGTDFELWQSFSENPLKRCPKSDGPPACTAPGKGRVSKVFSAPGITFKGGGFYKTDSRSTSGSGASKSSEGSDGSGSGTASSTSESSSSTATAATSAGSGSE